jgi:sec-independent protein translocase protein TatB
MFGFSWSEILIIGVVALVLIGPNDLPRAMKTAARWMSAGRKLAREFQSHVDDLVREAELEELREKARKLAMQPLSSHLESMVDPNREIAQSLTQSEAYQSMMTGQVPPPAAEPAAETVIPPDEPPAVPPPEHAAEPQTTP